MQLTTKTMSIDGRTVHYISEGEGNGRTLLLLHGEVGGAHVCWWPVIKPLAEQFHVLAPDLPGFGGSAELRDMRLAALVAWVRAFLDSLRIEQAVVVGNSVGALVARLFAAALPQYVPAAILVNGGVLPTVPQALTVAARVPLAGNALLTSAARSFYARENLDQMIHVKDVLTEDFARQAKNCATGYARLLRAILTGGLPEKHNPLVPTLLLWGTDDALTPVSDATALQRHIPGAQLTEIADCGHFPQLEASDTFIFQVNHYLDRLSRPPQMDLPGAGLLK